MSHGCTDPFVLRYLERDEVPKCLSMVELSQMTKLMDDQVVLRFGRKGDDFPIEIQIAITRTAPPSRALIFDEDFVV